MTRPLPIVWTAPLMTRAVGYGEEARGAVAALAAAGVDILADPGVVGPWEVEPPPGTGERIERVLAVEPPSRFVHVVHAVPYELSRHPQAEVAIGRTMFETETLPSTFAASCTAMDQVWVPGAFHVEAFVRGGVDPTRIGTVPLGIDEVLWRSRHRPLPLDGASGFVFLSVGTWSPRKGWDVLVRAYLDAFSPVDDVTLVLAVPKGDERLARSALQVLCRELDHDLDEAPPILVEPTALSGGEVPRLYAAADAFVLASHGEGWGLPYLEAMASGLPTIGTRWGGNLEFMHDGNSFLVDSDVVDIPEAVWERHHIFSGHRWAQPSHESLVEQLQRVRQDSADARRRGAEARAEVLDRFTTARVAEVVLERLKELGVPVARVPRSPRPMSSGAIEVTGVPASLLRALRATDVGAVPMQPGEAGELPVATAGAAAETWAPTRHARAELQRSGSTRPVAVVPPGIDPLVFHPDAAPLWLCARGAFRFACASPRSSQAIGEILRTYATAFSAADPVVLAIHDPWSPMRAPAEREALLAAQDAPDSPEVVYLSQPLSDEWRAALLAGFNAYLATTGAALTEVLEAMACGLAVVAAAEGELLDVIDPTVAYLYDPATGPTEALRHAARHPDEAQALGRRASYLARSAWSWASAADSAAARMAALGARRPTSGGRLSVCVIARDEEAFIRRCLESVREVADECVVVDSGSVDDTDAIARSLGATVVPFRWRDDFATARNVSLRHASCPWILVLDADERLDDGSREALLRIVSEEPLTSYLLTMRNYYGEAGDDAYVEHLNLRLFPNIPQLRFVGRDPHAQLVNLAPRPEVPRAVAPIVLHHDGYRPRIERERGKHERNRLALERAVAEHPHEPLHAVNLGRAYAVLGRDTDAEQQLARAIELGTGRDGETPDYLLGAHLSLALALHRQGRFDEAAERCRVLLRLAPGFADAELALGNALAAAGREDEALAAYGRVLDSAAELTTAGSDRTVTVKALLGTADLHARAGRDPEAEDALQRARVLSS